MIEIAEDSEGLEGQTVQQPTPAEGGNAETSVGGGSETMPHNPLVPSWADQDVLLRELWDKNLQPPEIAEQLNRSVAAVMTRAARLGLPRRFAPGRKAGQHYAAKPAVTGDSKRVATPVAPSTARYAGDTVAPPKPAERVCLMCLRTFFSAGRHNRICPACKGSADYAAGSRIPDINFGAG